jgi:transposase
MNTDTVECALCHAVHTEAFAGNPTRAWRCTRCGQQWDTNRAAAVANYQRWVKLEAAAIANAGA